MNPPPVRPLVWGHRGAMASAPQNTLPSFRLAAEQGADGVELDVQLTKDGVLVVFHDARVDALTDGRGPLASLTWGVVRKLDAGSHFGLGWAGTPIPTLEEVIEELPGPMVINVEMKTALSESPWWTRWITPVCGPQVISASRIAAARAEAEPLADALARILEPLAPTRFWISSFDPWALEAIAPRLPRVPLGFLHSPTLAWNTAKPMESLAHQAWHPHHSEVTAQSVSQAHGEGRKVHVWTVNDPRHAQNLAALGVDAVITNRPGDVREALGG